MEYCYQCMNRLNSQGKCDFCGFDQSNYYVEPHQLRPGHILRDRYILGNVIGEGGFGITYVGRDDFFNVKVAIKEFYMSGFVNRNNTYSARISAENGEKGELFQKNKERFYSEAKVLVQFSDTPGIVKVRDFFYENETAYIVMEYVEGKTLKEYLSEKKKLSVKETLEIAMPIMNALRDVHKENLIHRDLSPDNIILSENLQPTLIDFGAARFFAEDDLKSLSVILKHGYAPEEQYRRRGVQGPWTDIYAICATMYRCISGKRPDDALERLAADEVQELCKIAPECPKYLSDAIMKGLSVYQKDRYQNIADMKADIERGSAVIETDSVKDTLDIKNEASAISEENKVQIDTNEVFNTNDESTELIFNNSGFFAVNNANSFTDKNETSQKASEDVFSKPSFAENVIEESKKTEITETEKQTEVSSLVEPVNSEEKTFFIFDPAADFGKMSNKKEEMVVTDIPNLTGNIDEPEPVVENIDKEIVKEEKIDTFPVEPVTSSKVDYFDLNKSFSPPYRRSVESKSSPERTDYVKKPEENYRKVDEEVIGLISHACVGDYIKFGRYELYLNNLKSPIEWEVLSKENGKLLLISRFVLDVREYNETNEDVTWEKCSLRKWLNDIFLKSAFTKEEQSFLVASSLENENHPVYGTIGGNSTEDKVFLLSLNELIRFGRYADWNRFTCFGYGEDIMAEVTPFAKEKGCWSNTIDKDYYNLNLLNRQYSKNVIGKSSAAWWLRTPGYKRNNACYVSVDGNFGANYFRSSYAALGVRPSIYIGNIK